MAETENAGEKSGAVRPAPDDILSGRRGKRATYTHPGNERYHAVVALYLDRYVGETSKVGKTSIVRAIINLLVKKEGRRFLQKSKTSDEWYVMSRKATLDKVGHSLRDLKQQRVAEGVAKRLEAKKVAEQALRHHHRKQHAPTTPSPASALIQAPANVPVKFMHKVAVPAPAMSSSTTSLLQELAGSSRQRTFLQQHQQALLAARTAASVRSQPSSKTTIPRSALESQALLLPQQPTQQQRQQHLLLLQASGGGLSTNQHPQSSLTEAELRILREHRLLQEHRRFVSQPATTAPLAATTNEMERTLGLAQQLLESSTSATRSGAADHSLLQQSRNPRSLQELLDRHRYSG